ncbi:MAG: RagB/SusD family nutrient uptake outer membrane protein [Bacteroidota bacterium]
MKMLENIFKAVLVVVLVVLSGCSKEFLDVKPTGKTTESEFYKTDEDASMALIAAYDILQLYSLLSFDSPGMTRVLASDESVAAGGGPSDLIHFQEFDDYSYTTTNRAIKRAYEVFYFGVNRANLVIDNIDPTSEFRERIIAEAKVLRSFYYFELVTMFGGVPLHKTVPGANGYAKKRATVQDVYQFIEEGLTEAIPKLAHKSELSNSDQFRVSVETAQALLGKAYLYQEKWTEATQVFGDLILNEGSEVGLDPDYAHLWSPDGRWGQETLMNISFSSYENHVDAGNVWAETSRRGYEANYDVQLMGPRVEFYNLGTSDLLYGWGFNSPTESIYNAYVNAGDVLRRQATLMSEDELLNTYGGSVSPDAFGWHGSIRLKYATYADQTSFDADPVMNYGNNYRLLRYADVLLMAAEAYYRSGDENQARIELNKVRQRAGMGDVTAGGDDLFSAIILERQLELAFEGQRFFDLVRWGTAADILGSDGFVAGKHELFPIPQQEIDVNPAITAADQNPGW